MSKKSPFSRFIPFLWDRLKNDYKNIDRFEKNFCVAIPKSTSFYFGYSDKLCKHLIVNFQASEKPLHRDEFTINVHISEQLAPTKNWPGNRIDFEAMCDGYYRLASVAVGRDMWWCLVEKDPLLGPRNGANGLYWEPTSYEDEKMVFIEAAESISEFLRQHILNRLELV